MVLNLILLVVGLTICFGGLYFKRVSSAFIGFISGALGSLILVLLIAQNVRNFDESIIAFVPISAFVVAIISAIYYRVMAAINSFVSSFGIVAIVLFVMVGLRVDDSEILGIIMIALLCASGMSFFTFKFYDFSYIITTAFLGAIIANIGWYGLARGLDIEEVLQVILFRSVDRYSSVIIGTVVLGVLGFIVQFMRLTKQNSASVSHKPNYTMNFDAIDKEIPIESISNKANTALNAVRTSTKPLFTEAFHRIKDAIKVLSTNSGRADLIKQLTASLKLFIIPVVCFLILNNAVIRLTGNLIYGSVSYYLYTYLQYLGNGITIGILVYFVIAKDTKTSMCVALIFNFIDSVFRLNVLSYWSVWTATFILFRYLFYWLILLLADIQFKKDNARGIIICAIASILHLFVYDTIGFLTFFQAISFGKIVCAASIFGTVYLLFEKLYGINVFVRVPAQMKSSPPEAAATRTAQKRNGSPRGENLHYTERFSTNRSNHSNRSRIEQHSVPRNPNAPKHRTEVEFCDFCGSIINLGETKCSICNTPVKRKTATPARKIESNVDDFTCCPHCFAMIDSTDSFCSECGVRIK